MSKSPFSHERDPELGAALSELLSASDHEAFAQGVVARFHETRRSNGSYWEVLGSWGRAGVGIAVAVAAAAVLVILPRNGEEATPGAVEAVLAEPSSQLPPAPLVESPGPPDPDVVLAAVYGR